MKIPLEKAMESKVIDNRELKIVLKQFIWDSSGRTRKEINDYIYPLLNEEDAIMNNRVRTALTYLRTNKIIKNIGTDTKPIWIKN